jgi:predicted PurR-regulated permease PerM
LLHPFIMGRAVQLHPAVILFAITAGGVLAGVVGVFLAIPMAASLACIFGYIREQQAE